MNPNPASREDVIVSIVAEAQSERKGTFSKQFKAKAGVVKQVLPAKQGDTEHSADARDTVTVRNKAERNFILKGWGYEEGEDGGEGGGGNSSQFKSES